MYGLDFPMTGSAVSLVTPPCCCTRKLQWLWLFVRQELFSSIIVLQDHHHICTPFLAETSLWGTWLYHAHINKINLTVVVSEVDRETIVYGVFPHLFLLCCILSCVQILRCCNSKLASTRQEACALLYLLMRTNFDFTSKKNFTRVHLQVRMQDTCCSFVQCGHIREWILVRKAVKEIMDA